MNSRDRAALEKMLFQIAVYESGKLKFSELVSALENERVRADIVESRFWGLWNKYWLRLEIDNAVELSGPNGDPSENPISEVERAEALSEFKNWIRSEISGMLQDI